MEADYWHDKWAKESIGFHQSSANKRLQQWWPEIDIADGAEVFVPLCGKSLDMLWLHQQGHKVLGIELSQKAIEDFFNENSLEYERATDGPFEVFTGLNEAEGIKLLLGDLFELSKEHCRNCVAVYDRASLIAMNDDLRPRYAEHLAAILSPGVISLLLTIDYDVTKMSGPPFAVPDSMVTKLFNKNFDIRELGAYSGPKRVGNLAERGLDTLEERVYRLHRL